MLPAVLGTQLLGRNRVALAEQAERLLVGPVELAAVDREPRRWDGAVSNEPFDVVGDPAGADGLGLAGVAQDPYRAARAGVDRGQDSFDLVRRGLGELVQDDHGARCQWPIGQVEAQPGDGPRLQAGTGQLGHRLGRGGHGHHRAAAGCRGLGGGVEHGGLAVPGRGQHRPQAPALPRQHLDRGGLVLPQPRRRRPGRLQDGAFDSRDLTAGQGAHEGQGAVFHGPVGDGRPLRRPAPPLVPIGGQPHCQVGGQEPLGHGDDLLDTEAAAGEGADVLDDIGRREPGRPGAQPGLWADKSGHDFLPLRRVQRRLLPAHRVLQPRSRG